MAETTGSTAGQFPNKSDIKSVLWNLLMVEGAAATVFLGQALPGLNLNLNPVQSIAYMLILPAVFAGLKLANKWFSDNTGK